MNQAYLNHPDCGPVIEMGYVSRDIEHTIEAWVSLVGAGPFFVDDCTLDYAADGNQSALPVTRARGASGNMLIEIIQPRDGADSVFSRALASQRNGPHTLRYQVADAAAHAAQLSRTGHTLLATVTHPDGERLDYFGDVACVPFLVKAVQPCSPSVTAAEALLAAHRHWDGKQPVRPLSMLHPGIA